MVLINRQSKGHLFPDNVDVSDENKEETQTLSIQVSSLTSRISVPIRFSPREQKEDIVRSTYQFKGQLSVIWLHINLCIKEDGEAIKVLYQVKVSVNRLY